MGEVVGVRFKRAGQIYYFDSGELELKAGDEVVVDTSRGVSLGRVAVSSAKTPVDEPGEPVKLVLRKAAKEDIEQQAKYQAQAAEDLVRGRRMVAESHIPMKLLFAEFNLDGSRLTFYFSAEGRVDFRSLVRDMTSIFGSKVELRQIGARDETKLFGGFGRCGRPLCCASHICHFESISMRMAKDQDLPLNPTKISGVCGRLLCCLSYELEQYRSMKESMPKIGSSVITPVGEATVVGGNPMKETVLVQVESEAIVEVPLHEVQVKEEERRRRPRSGQARR